MGTFASWVKLLACLAGVFLFVVITIGLGFQGELYREAKVILLAVAAMLFGVAVGAAEILSRYRDEPFLVLIKVPAAAYMLLNGLISFACFALLLRYGSRLFPPAAGDLVLSALAAGFGGMMIARSKLFTYQGESGADYSFGPAIVLEAFLKTLDRRIDRSRSAERQKRVIEQVQKLNVDQAGFEFALQYLQASLQAYQNLSQAEKSEFSKELDAYRELAAWPLVLRMLAVGFAFLNLSGEENFDQVMKELAAALKERRQAPAGQAPPPEPV
jgi:hypothetical protein